MGALSLNKADTLYWLGRYAQRALALSDRLYHAYDSGLGPGREANGVEAIADFCTRLGITERFPDRIDFLHSFFLDANVPFSMAYSIHRAYDNGFVLRDILSNEVFTYLRMAYNTIDSLSSPDFFEIKAIIDLLFAFWGGLEDWVDEYAADICRWGRIAEDIDIYLRFGERERAQELAVKLARVLSGLGVTKLPALDALPEDEEAAQNLVASLFPAVLGVDNG